MMKIRSFYYEEISLSRCYEILRKRRSTYSNTDIINFYKKLHKIDMLTLDNKIVLDIDELPEPISNTIRKRVVKNINSRIKKIESIIDDYIQVNSEQDMIDHNLLKSFYDEAENLRGIKRNDDIVVEILRP